MKVVFQGMKNGRPRFDIGNNAPPKWLRELVERAKVDGDTLQVDGKVIKPGETVAAP